MTAATSNTRERGYSLGVSATLCSGCFDGLTSAEGDCGARMMLQTLLPSSVTS